MEQSAIKSRSALREPTLKQKFWHGLQFIFAFGGTGASILLFLVGTEVFRGAGIEERIGLMIVWSLPWLVGMGVAEIIDKNTDLP